MMKDTLNKLQDALQTLEDLQTYADRASTAEDLRGVIADLLDVREELERQL